MANDDYDIEQKIKDILKSRDSIYAYIDNTPLNSIIPLIESYVNSDKISQTLHNDEDFATDFSFLLSTLLMKKMLIRYQTKNLSNTFSEPVYNKLKKILNDINPASN